MTHRVTQGQAAEDDRFLRSLSDQLNPVGSWGAFRRGARAAAVTAILYQKRGNWHMPFVLRRPDLPSHPGQVGLPGGGVRAGEDAWAAAAREAEEEISVPAASLRPLGAGPAVYAAVSNYSVVPFVAWLPSPPRVFVPDPGELVGVLDVPLATLLDESAWRVVPPLPGPQLQVAGSVIWGLTGKLLDGLLPVFARALREASR